MPKDKDNKTAEKEDTFQAILLADNFTSSIFGPDFSSFSEALLTVANRKLIDYAIEALVVSGVQEIFLYCTKDIESFKKYIETSKYSDLSSTSINLISSESSHSLGDALRDLDARGSIRNDFILMQIGAVTNIMLRDLFDKHRETMAKDKGALMTLIHRKLGKEHRSRAINQNSGFVVDSNTNKIITYNKNLNGKKVRIPLAQVPREMDIFLDTVDTGITICSYSVLPIFTDNFDFSTLDDFIKGILINEEIMGNSLYFHRLENGYANKISDIRSFSGISCDIIQRWTYPIVPDISFTSNPLSYNEPPINLTNNFVYKGENIKLSTGIKIGPSALIGNNTTIGSNSKISFSSIEERCKIGSNVVIFNSFIRNNATIEDNCILKNMIVGEWATVPKGTKISSFSYATKEKIYPIKEELDMGEEDEDEDEEESDESDVELDLDQENANFDSSDEIENVGIQDVDFQTFSNEVLESLIRAYQESVALENLILEINSSKFANNITLKEVTVGVAQGVLSILPKLNKDFKTIPLVSQLEKTKDVVEKFKDLIRHYSSKTHEAQIDLLNAIEEFANDNTYFRPLLMQILNKFYQDELLTEDSVLEWYKNPSLYAAAQELRNNVKKFIEWLEEAESESEDSDDEE